MDFCVKRWTTLTFSSSFQKFLHKTLAVVEVHERGTAHSTQNQRFNLSKSGQNVENREFFSFGLRRL